MESQKIVLRMFYLSSMDVYVCQSLDLNFPVIKIGFFCNGMDMGRRAPLNPIMVEPGHMVHQACFSDWEGGSLTHTQARHLLIEGHVIWGQADEHQRWKPTNHRASSMASMLIPKAYGSDKLRKVGFSTSMGD